MSTDQAVIDLFEQHYDRVKLNRTEDHVYDDLRPGEEMKFERIGGNRLICIGTPFGNIRIALIKNDDTGEKSVSIFPPSLLTKYGFLNGTVCNTYALETIFGTSPKYLNIGAKLNRMFIDLKVPSRLKDE